MNIKSLFFGCFSVSRRALQPVCFLPAAKPTGHGMMRVVVGGGGTTLRS